MKRRALAAGVILLLWLGGLGLLIRREYFQPNLERFAEAAMRIAPGTVYYGVENAGRLIGFASSTIDTATTSVAVDDYLVADVPMGGEPHRTTVRAHVEMSRALRVRRFDVHLDADKGPVEATGRVYGDTLLEVAIGSGKAVADTQRVALHGPILMPTMVPLAIALGEKPKVGRHYLLPVFDLTSLSAHDVDFAVTAESLFVVSDSAANTPPAMPPPSRRATRKASTIAVSAPARATATHNAGAAHGTSAKSVVTATGSGFQDGPNWVSRCRCSTSRPQINQAYGS